MKPVTLTMKAFGSFAKETTVSFENFNGLYLLVGETGAGKTTIFDAITYALFGTASGYNRSKEEMLHSDYTDKSEPTEVCLVFEHGGKRYKVTRGFSFHKKSGTKNQSAELLFPDGQQPVTGTTNVTNRCKELLGLDAEQFRRIVMLAQGEFRKFLEAKAKDKGDILGKLFDTSRYESYQKLLKAAKDKLKQEREGKLDAVRSLMKTFIESEELDPADSCLYNPENPQQLLENLDRLIESGEITEKELSEAKKVAQEAVDDTNIHIGKVKSDNKLLEELNDKRKHEKELRDQRSEKEQLSEQLEKAKAALHKVVPVRDKSLAAKRSVEDTKGEIELLSKEFSESEERYYEAKAKADGDAEAKDRIAVINTERSKLKDSLPQYETLNEKQSALTKANKEAERITQELENAQKEYQDREKKLTDAKKELEDLADADTNAAQAETHYQQAQTDAETLNGEKGIRKGVDAVKKDDRELAEEKDKLAELITQASEASDDYNRKYKAFIGGQAGLMAAELEKELQSNGRAFCPVCGVEHHLGETHSFAVKTDDTPAQSDVDAAKKLLEEFEQQRQDQQRQADKLENDLKNRRQNLTERAQKLFPDASLTWEVLSEESFLDEAAKRFERAEEDANSALKKASGKKKRKGELIEHCKDLEEKQKGILANIDRCMPKKDDAKNKAVALDAEIKALKSHLQFETLEEAEEKLKKLDDEFKRLDGQINANQKALDKAKDDLNTKIGELNGKKEDLPKREAEEAKAKADYEAALKANGFEGEAALSEALAPIGDEDGEGWLEKRRKELNDYRNECANTEKRIKELEDQTRSLSFIKEEDLQTKLKEAEEQRKQADEAHSKQSSRQNDRRTTRSRAAEDLKELAKTDGVWKRLNKLAVLAAGEENAEGGKLSFERYVLGAVFKEVLEMANRRLDIMSGGQYSLIHRMTVDRKNSAAGLEINVLDAATGKQRATETLSGGESFQVSLSLALGLSDTVQQYAGGIGLDTMFIDEGFGTLDSGALDNAIEVLHLLTEGNRLVGVISHVDKLAESIPQKLRIIKTAHGSELSLEI